MSDNNNNNNNNNDSKDSNEGKLPHGWSKGFSKSQNRYYYCHPESKHTQWHFPTASEVADPLKAKQRAQMNIREMNQRANPNTNTNTNISANSSTNTSTHSSTSTTSTRTTNKRPLVQEVSALGDILKTVPKVKVAKTSSSPTNITNITNNNNQQNGKSIHTSLSSTCIAIIVPYRDLHPSQNRAKHLSTFIPHMHSFLSKLLSRQLISDYHIYIIEQSDDQRKFNRGKLLNIGFDLARKNKCRTNTTTTNTYNTNNNNNNTNNNNNNNNTNNNNSNNNDNTIIPHDVFIFHDVDLLPNDDLAQHYSRFPTTPIHIARVWNRYSNNPKYFGGIVSFSSSDMKRINGYPNTFWGWGGEDDEMQKRCERLGLKWDAPRYGTIVDLEEMNLNEKLDFLRRNKEWKCMVKWEALEEHESTWRVNGLADLNYKVLNIEDLDKDRSSLSSGQKSRATKITVDVKLNGNHWSNAKAGVDYMG